MNFLEELQKATNGAVTENGGATNASTLDPCLDFFALGAAKRGRLEDVSKLFTKAYLADKTTALRTMFYFRDIRGGQGERDIFRTCLDTLSSIDIKNYEHVLQFVPEYGRWDDLYGCGKLPTIPRSVVGLIKNQLESDMKSEAPSLLAKWLPSENASSVESKKRARELAHALGVSYREYRKIVSKLRKKIHLLEQDMSSNNWGEIDYGKLPSQAFRKHTAAFNRHDKERFDNFFKKVDKGEAKINTSTVTTAEVIQNVKKGDDKAANAIWKSLDNFVPDDLNAIVVADVSGSMYGRPMEICTSLALYFAERNNGLFHNKFMTFSERPHLVEIYGASLTEKLRSIETADWGMNTNIEATLDALLRAAKTCENAELVPKVIYIISDMEFDYCVTGADETAFENARRKWHDAGFKMPTVVFWNVNSHSNNNLPATKFDKNVVLVSGSNQNTFRFALEGKTPVDLMKEVIDSERYRQIEAL